MFSSQELNALIVSFGQSERTAGLKIFRQGDLRIEQREETDNEVSWTAEVTSGRTSLYRLSINLRREGRRAVLKSSCSCAGDRCVHVAAVLWGILADRRDEENWEREQGLDQDFPATAVTAAPSMRIPAPLQTWITALDKATVPHTRLAYRLIDMSHVHLPPAIWRVTCEETQEGRRIHGQALADADLNELLDPVDQRLDALLRTQTRHNRGFILQGPLVHELLEELLASERFYYGLEGSLQLVRKEPRAASIVWQLVGEQWGFGIAHQQPSDKLLPCFPALLLNSHSGEVTPLTFEMPDTLAQHLLQAPLQDEEALTETLPLMRPKLEIWGIETPPALVNRDYIQGDKPQPTLRFFKHLESLPQVAIQRERLLASLIFVYAGYEVTALPFESRSYLRLPDKRVVVERARAVEQQMLSRLAPLQPMYRVLGWQCPDNISHFLGLRHDDANHWLPVLNLIPMLQSQGWNIEFAEDFPWTWSDIEADALVGRIEDDDEAGWFGMSLSVEIEGERVALIPLLLETLESLSADNVRRMMEDEGHEDAFLTVIHQGQLLRLPLQRMRPLLSMLLEIFDRQPDIEVDTSGRLRLSRLDAAEFVVRVGDRWQGGDILRRLGAKLAGFDGLESIPVPPSLQAELRHYQQEGLNWLQFLAAHQLSGILADDMGLGKTVQTIAHLCVEKAAGRLQQPTLIVCPKSVLPNWRQELARFAPSLSLLSLEGQHREAALAALQDKDIILTSYSLLTRDIETLAHQTFSLLICDEAQQLKNHKTQTARAMRRLQAGQTIALTGTPMENHLGELWALFDLLLPGFLGQEAHFRKLVRNPVEKLGDLAVAQRLSRRIKPLMLRRTKEQVARELPPKTEIVQHVIIQDEQRDLYEVVRASMDSRVRQVVAQKGLARSNIEILEALLKLRQVCCDPRLLREYSQRQVAKSAKLAYLMEVLPALIEDGRRILLFSQFTSMLSLIAQELDAANLRYVTLTGSTTDRETPVKRFQAGEVPLFLLSLKAGGVGLNLTAADTVFIYDPWWNPAVENQAADRAYRIGQDKPVFVYKLVCEGTVEERIIALQQRKSALASGIYGEEAHLEQGLSAEDIEELFKPLQSIAD